MMTAAPTPDLKAAAARAAEAIEAFDRADYAAAARDFTKAAELFTNAAWKNHGTRNSPEADNMRRLAREAIQRRDQQEAQP